MQYNRNFNTVNATFILDKRIISALYNICATASYKASSEKKLQVAQIVSSKRVIILRYKPSSTLQTPQGHG